ncbi:MAG TPA: hypothetical protein VGJ16_03085 [Pirellulales bacterium]|jgi:hypothetical protein
MTKLGTYHALNQLLTVLYRSLPMYLDYACPWTHRGDEKALATLRNIVADQKQLSTRVAQAVMAIGPTEIGEFPIEFLDMHDLSLDFLIKKLIEYQKQDIAALEKCAGQLVTDRKAAALAEEALGAARGHLESLEELASQPASNGA